MSVITFICAGQMNSALTFPAFENGNEVRLVGSALDDEIITRLKKDNYHTTLKRTLYEGIKYYYFSQLSAAISGADLFILGVSSLGIDWFCGSVLDELPDNIPILSVTKGMITLENGTMISYPEYFESKQGDNRGHTFCAVGGPCTSYELADHDDSMVCYCGKNIKALECFKKALSTDYYHISISKNVKGVEFAVALKNIYALGVTLAVGLSEKREGREGVLHYNSQAALFEQSLKEMMKLLKLQGCSYDSILYGAGDLYVTIYGGRTRMIGTLLGRGMSYSEAIKKLSNVTLESIVIATRTATAVKEMDKLGIASISDFPLLMHVNALINENAKVNIPWKQFV